MIIIKVGLNCLGIIDHRAQTDRSRQFLAKATFCIQLAEMLMSIKQSVTVLSSWMILMPPWF